MPEDMTREPEEVGNQESSDDTSTKAAIDDTSQTKYICDMCMEVFDSPGTCPNCEMTLKGKRI